MKLSDVIQQELEKQGLRTIREAARYMGVSTEQARIILRKGHIPKDSVLIRIARALRLDPAILITTGHRERLPLEMQREMLSVAPPSGGDWEQKRKWPLSQEQCAYLGRVMQTHEIQFIRKCRQLTPEERLQAAGYVDYMFATCRVPPPAPAEEQQPASAARGESASRQ